MTSVSAVKKHVKKGPRNPSFPRYTMFSLIRAQPATLLRRARSSSLTVAYGLRQNHSIHTPDSYTKEVDYTPPSDDKIHRVDPESDRVQKPYEAPSGEWSRAGVQADKYRSVEHPYAPNGERVLVMVQVRPLLNTRVQ